MVETITKPSDADLETATRRFEASNLYESNRKAKLAAADAAPEQPKRIRIRGEAKALGAILLASLVAAAAAPRDRHVESSAANNVAQTVSHDASRAYDGITDADMAHVDIRAVDQSASAQHQIRDTENPSD